MPLWLQIPSPDGDDDHYRRRDGFLVIFHSADRWNVAKPNNDFIRTKQNKIRTWKTHTAAMKAVDREFPYSPPWSRAAAFVRAHKTYLRSTLPAWITGNG